MRTLKVIGVGSEYGLVEREDWGGVSHVLQRSQAVVYGDGSGTLCVLDRNYIAFRGAQVPKAVRFYDREDEWKQQMAPNPANKLVWEKAWKYKKHLAFFGMNLPEAMEALKARAFQVEGKSGLWVM